MPDLSDITDLDYQYRITERTKVSTDGRQVRVERTQRCDPIIEAVKDARDLRKGSHMRHAASIPLVVWHKWLVEEGIPPGTPDTTRIMAEVIKRKMQSNEWNKLLVHGF